MKRVQEAAAKLREAGLPEQADRLIREAEAIFSGHGPMHQQPMLTPVPSMPGMGPSLPMRPGGPSGMMSGAPMYPGMMSPPQATQPSAAGGYPGIGGPAQATQPPAAGGFGMMSPPVQPGMPPGGMPPGGAANREIRDQLRQLQKQIEELRRELQEVKQGRSPRATDRAKRPAASDGDNPFDERPKREARPARADDPFAEPAPSKSEPPRR
jgi:hypothetical protein